MYFSNEQVDFMKSIGIDVNFDNPSNEEWDELAFAVDDYLMLFGFEGDYVPNEKGKICEEILDIVSTS